MMSNAKGVLTNGGASLEFMQFVLALGWIVNPATHWCAPLTSRLFCVEV